jgi:DNA-binding GntR family transcriptional regulator
VASSTPPAKRKFSRTILSEQIKEQIIEDIFHKKYKPGDRIVESALARDLNVSQASVREALRSLIAMGFLESEPFKGITVRSFTSKDLWEVYTVRIALETLAAQLAVERMTDEEISNLEKIVDKMIEAGKERNIPKRTHLNNEFHERLVKASGNKLILQLLQYMRFGSWSIMTGNLTQMDPVFIAARHRLLIDAIKSRDPERVASTMREHIESTGKPIAESLDS